MTSRKSGHGTPWIVSGEEIYPPMMMSDGARSPELAANEGIYTEHYLVTLTPMTSSEWDAYVISQNPESAEFIVLLDDPDYILTTYDVILLPSDYVESSERLNARREEPAA